MNYSMNSKRLDLIVNWKLSRNETLFKENYFLEITQGNITGIGEVAPNIRYGETREVIEKNFSDLCYFSTTLENLEEFKKTYKPSHSFLFGVESALIDLKSKAEQIEIYEALNIASPRAIETSFSIPIMKAEELESYINKYNRFSFFKVKVNKNNAASFVKNISRYTDKPLRIDGNEAWDSLADYLEFEEEVKNLNIQFIEQPFKSSMVSLYQELKPISRFDIMGDESIETNVDMKLIASQFHSINVKLMKSSGFFNAISLLKEARAYGLKTMLGCMIESSLGISYALNLSSLADFFDLDGSLLLKNDPYKDLICEQQGKLFLP